MQHLPIPQKKNDFKKPMYCSRCMYVDQVIYSFIFLSLYFHASRRGPRISFNWRCCRRMTPVLACKYFSLVPRDILNNSFKCYYSIAFPSILQDFSKNTFFLPLLCIFLLSSPCIYLDIFSFQRFNFICLLHSLEYPSTPCRVKIDTESCHLIMCWLYGRYGPTKVLILLADLQTHS